MRVGESVRQAREKLGLSTLDVARHIPMDERYIIQIELASVVPGSEVLRKLCAALSLDGDALERQRRQEYIERDLEKGRISNKSNVKPINVAAMTAKPVQPVTNCHDLKPHKCEPDPMLAKGEFRLCVTVPPVVWDAFMQLKKDLYQYSGVEPTLRSLVNMTILSVHHFKTNQPEHFTFAIKDFGDNKL